MRSERIVGMALCGLLALGGQAVADDGLGVGRGIDHVGMLVRLVHHSGPVAAGGSWFGFITLSSHFARKNGRRWKQPGIGRIFVSDRAGLGGQRPWPSPTHLIDTEQRP